AAEQHGRWGLADNPPASRRLEDLESCRRLGAEAIHLTLPDCIYRRSPKSGGPMYASEMAIFGSIHPDEDSLVDELARIITERVSPTAAVVCPLAIGGHVDHQLAFAAAQKIRMPMLYYADYPYVGDDERWLATGSPLSGASEWTEIRTTLSDANLAAWGDSVAPFVSQIPMFWSGEAEMRAAIESYYKKSGFFRLWTRSDQPLEIPRSDEKSVI
ncbi:MAG: hypothetical protein R3335_04400, partial [Anaerolineales bacterium]|nr:hypothetical protein [Anaerolineales bacterium]